MTFISDIEGNAAFYSNGCSIRNTNHELMENGDSLLPNDYDCDKYGYMRHTHGGGVTVPGFSSHQYIMFSISVDLPYPPQPCEFNRLVAHYIDISAQQGKGEVTVKGQEILTGCFQEPSANRHANGRDWWILLPDSQVDKFYRWLLTPYGLEGPWEQVLDNPAMNEYTYWGWSEFSPDGQRYLINHANVGKVVYEFDRCSGLLSQPLFLPETSIWNFAASFSQNSRFLYSTSNGIKTLCQYDLSASDVSASKVTLAEWDGAVDSFNVPAVFGYIQHGPDGKLYIWAGGSAYMHIIDFPNRSGSDCNIRQRAIQLPGICFGPSLYYPNYRLGPIDESSCDTLGIDNLPSALFRYDIEDTLNPLQVTFTDVSSYLPTAWHWDFGDGAMSQDTNPVHTYALPGTYNVCLIVSNAFAADTFCRQVTVGTTGIHELPALPHAAVMPNPFSSELRVQLPALVGVSPHFVLYDLFGREVKSAWLRDFDTYLSLSQLPAGMYVWQLRWNGVVTQSGRVVKQ
ncbi:MAG: PKD domain-containing protein [Saprospiraceae bacterium]